MAFVVPADVDDPALVSGGNVYDLRIVAGLPAAGWAVELVRVAGRWPRPGAAAHARLDAALAELPDGSVVLLDGLIGCAAPDVVVAHTARLVIVVLVHLPLAEEGGVDLAAGEARVLRAAAAVVATSPWIARRLALPRAVAVCVPGVDPAPLAPGSDGHRLLCVGAVTPMKGHDLLVEALAGLADLPWTCDIVGPLERDPDHVARVRTAITRHGLDGRVRVTGPRSHPDLDTRYARADLLVLPSRVEAFGMVLVEALARGIPVLATDAGGVPEAVGTDPCPGLLVPPADVDALAAALRRWLTEPPLREHLRGVARDRRATMGGWETTSRCLGSVLGTVLGTAAEGRG